MRITVNGEIREVDDGATVAALLDELGLGERWVVVDLNGEAVQRSEMTQRTLKAHDVVQIVRPVAGGAERRGLGVLYLVADPDRLDPSQILPLARAGVDVLQLRMKEATTADRVAVGRRWHDATAEASIPLVVNDDPDAAVQIGAEGLHLGQNDLSPVEARRIVGDDILIGLSTHTLPQVEAALELRGQGIIDYIGVGPYTETPTKPGREAIEAGLLSQVADLLTFPWFAIGGIGELNLSEVLAAGATRVAVVRAILDAPDPTAATSRLANLLIGASARPTGAGDL